MKTSGYSGTPLAKKLGYKEGFKVRIVNEPGYYLQLFSDLPAVKFMKDKKVKKNLIHFFTKEADELKAEIKQLRGEIEPGGMIWISWPKKSSKVATDMDEHVVRGLALRNALVDVKVCAVDEIWTAMKLVIRLKDRR